MIIGVERAFLTDAASGGMMEVELRRYAASHAASDRFDRAYMETMVEETLPTLEAHLDMAKQISSGTGHPTSGARTHGD
jgi:hypothetical protein